MKVSIEELVNDINKSKLAEITFAVLDEAGNVKHKTVAYEDLRLEPDKKGAIPLGDYQSEEGFMVSDLFNIYREGNLTDDGKATYEIDKVDKPLLKVELSMI